MRVLLVHAHPSNNSFSAALRDAAAEALADAGHDVVVRDLYRENFVPTMSAAERLAYDSDDPVSDPQVREHADLLREVEMLVFVYPTWWWGIPAILKGWFDRALVPSEALVLERSFGPPRPGLTNIRRVVGITTYGSSKWASRILPDGGRRLIRRALRFLCSPRLRTTWLGFYGVDTAEQAEREAFVAKVRSTLGAIS